MFRNWICSGFALATVFLLDLSALASAKAPEKEKQKGSAPVALEATRPVDEVLKCFGHMLYVHWAATDKYGASTPRGVPLVAIDFVGNESGNDRLPHDSGQIVRNALEKIGQFRTFRVLPESLASTHIAAASVLPDRSKPSRYDFRVVGSILRATEIQVKAGNKRGDATLSRGHTAIDGGITADRGGSITSITFALTIETSDTVSVPAGTVEYRIDIEQTEAGRAFSLFIAGSGISFGSRAKATQDTADALAQLIGMSVVHAFGRVLRVPYHLCSPIFPPDRDLEAIVLDESIRTAQSQLERQLKRYMVVAGFPVDQFRSDLIATDRAIVAIEMRKRKLDPQDHRATAEMLVQVWRGLDHPSAAKRVSSWLADVDWQIQEAIEKQSRARSALSVSPVEFGFPATARIALLDISRVPAMQREIIAALKKCAGCLEIRQHPQQPLFGITTSKVSDIQYALSKASLNLDYVWYDSMIPHLLLVPLAKSTAQASQPLSRE